MTTKKHSPKLLERAASAAKRRLYKTKNACTNIGRIFTGDLQKIRNNTIAWIVVMGLTIVPSLYAWFNIAASWDPYGNTGNLKVAVANMDAGYRGSLFPMTLNVGDQVEMNLHHNTQLDWVFTDEDAAIRGVQEGTYYAAIVLPETFSRDMMSLFSAEDIQRSDILYYLNEKENAIAPKITDKGASAVQKQIDQVFVQTVSEIGLDLLEGLNQALDEGKKKDAMQNFSRNLGSLAAELEDVAALTDNYADISASLGKITDSAAALLHASVGNAGKAQQSLQEVIESVSDLTGAVTGAGKAVNLALQQTKDSYLEIEAQIDEAMDLFYQDVETAQQTLLDLSEQVMQQAEATQKIQKSLENLQDSLPSGSADLAQALDVVIRTLQTQIELQQELSSGLKEAAQELLTTKAEIEQRRQSLKAELRDSYAQITLLQADYEKNIEAKLLQLIEGFEASGTAVIDLLDQADRAAAQVDDTTGEISDHLTALQSALRDTSKTLHAETQKLRRTAGQIDRAVETEQMENISDILGTDPTEVSTFLSAPVKLKTTKFYPVENYGSAMAPFYSVLSIWVGGIVLAAMMKVSLEEKRKAMLTDVTPTQIYLGRQLLFWLIGLFQSGLICLGDLYFLEIQCKHPFYFLLAGWFTSIVFVNMIYTLTVSFGDIGKAICVVLLVIQVAGSGGTFPIEMTPMFFQKLYVLLPFTHSMMAMRECIAGFYENTYWVELGNLCWYLAASLLLGLVLRKPIIKLNEAFNEKLEETKVI